MSSGDLWPASQSPWTAAAPSHALGTSPPGQARIVTFGRPGGEDHDDTSTTITCDAVASPGSSVSSVPGPASTTSPPASIRAVPSTTISQARSRTWWSPSSSPAPRRTMIARAPSTVSRRSRMVGLALLPEPRPKARNLPTRYGARDVGAQANRIRRAGPAFRLFERALSSGRPGGPS
jgi:hypothetical protein